MTRMETQLPSFLQVPGLGQHAAHRATCVSTPALHRNAQSSEETPLGSSRAGSLGALCNGLITGPQRSGHHLEAYTTDRQRVKCYSNRDPHNCLSITQSENCFTRSACCPLTTSVAGNIFQKLLSYCTNKKEFNKSGHVTSTHSTPAQDLISCFTQHPPRAIPPPF